MSLLAGVLRLASLGSPAQKSLVLSASPQSLSRCRTSLVSWRTCSSRADFVWINLVVCTHR